jgi:hypothetical protein
MISVERACRRSSLLAGVHHRAPFPIGELPGSLLVSGWLEELLIGWRKQSSTPIGIFSVIPAGCRLAGRTPHWLA